MIDSPVRHGGLTRELARRPSLLNSRAVALLIFLVVLSWSLSQAGIFNRDLVNQGGWTQVWRFISAASRPDFSQDILNLAFPSMLVTLAFAVAGTAVSMVIGIIGGVLSSEVWWQSVFPQRYARARRPQRHILPWVGIRAFLAVPRAIHEVIWGLFFLNVLGLDPLVAILAIGIPFGTITAKVYADILDETPRDVLRALQSSGVTPLKAFLYSLLPQALPDLISYGFYRLECAIRSVAVLGLIGAGGLGFQILLSLQSLNYEQVWTFLYLLIILSGLTDGWSSLLHRRLSTSRYTNSRTDGQRRAYANVTLMQCSVLALLLLVPWSFWYVQVDVTKLFAERTTRLLAGVARDVFPPNLDPGLLGNLLQLSAQTLSMSILAMMLAGFGGLLLSFPAAANLSLSRGILDAGSVNPLRGMIGGVVLLASRGFLLVSRALSEGIWALLVLFVLFPGILPGAIALGMYNLGVVGRLMAEVTENADPRPLVALKGQGASNAQIFFYGVLPQTLSKNLAYVLYRWEVCVRATVVVGLVGAGGLGRLLGDQLSSFDYSSVLTSLLFFVGLTFLVDMTSALARRSIR